MKIVKLTLIGLLLAAVFYTTGCEKSPTDNDAEVTEEVTEAPEEVVEAPEEVVEAAE